MTELELMANEEARHGNREALERLEAELREARMTELSALGQAQEAYAAQQRLEDKLAKAVEALQKMDVGEGWAAQIARATLAELTGGDDE